MAEMNVVDMVAEKIAHVMHLATDEYVRAAIQSGRAGRENPVEAEKIMDEIEADFLRVMKSVRKLAVAVADREDMLK